MGPGSAQASGGSPTLHSIYPPSMDRLLFSYCPHSMALRGNVLSYFQMCQAEGTSLQRGMNFRPRGRHSIFLMFLRVGAPYRDRVENDGTTLIYEGHDAARDPSQRDPK